MKLRDLLENSPIPRREMRRLLSHLTGFSLSDLFLREDFELFDDDEIALRAMMKKRLEGMPMAYILGEANFYGRDFYVNSSVLIPRPETEQLIEKALQKKAFRILDLCTGSGIIAITLSLAWQRSVDASDISADALAVARKNAKRHGASVNVIESDLFSAISGSYDLILSNPPYIDSEVLKDLEVSRFEPNLALNGGQGGFEIYERLLPQAYGHLEAGGRLILEIGYDQAEVLRQRALKIGFTDIQVEKDLAGFDRVFSASKADEGVKHDR